MEKTKDVYLIHAGFDWSDLGTWGSVFGHMEKDYLRNAVMGKAMVFNSAGNLAITTKEGKLIVLDGLTDFIVVDTEDVLLICRKEDEQELREIVNNVKKEFGDNYV
jgi:mannose-1-phosphate guanylyltransferase